MIGDNELFNPGSTGLALMALGTPLFAVLAHVTGKKTAEYSAKARGTFKTGVSLIGLGIVVFLGAALSGNSMGEGLLFGVAGWAVILAGVIALAGGAMRR